MGGEGIAPARVGGESRRSAMPGAGPDVPGQRKRSLTRGAAGEQVEAFVDPRRSRCGVQFPDRCGAQGFRGRDFGGGLEVEVEFHCQFLVNLELLRCSICSCAAYMARVGKQSSMAGGDLS